MSITFKCKISLSKKLRALMGQAGTISLTAEQIIDGRGEGTVYISGDYIKDVIELTEELKNETSIMFTPTELLSNAPNSSSLMHGSIFSTSVKDNDQSPVVRKLAAVTPPEKGQESKAIKETITIPEEFKELMHPKCKQWISNLTELVEAVNIAKTKKSTIDLDSAQNDRERAVLIEMKEKEEAIDIPAWIVNETSGSMFVNDLNINLPLNSPFDLSNISSKRLAASKDIRGLIKAELVKFISPDEIGKYIDVLDAEDEKDNGLQVFSRHEEAEASITNLDTDEDDGPSRIHNYSKNNGKKSDLIAIEEVNDNNVEDMTEEESTMINLTQNMPKIKKFSNTPTQEPTSSHTSHGNNTPPKKSSVKPIQKIIR